MTTFVGMDVVRGRLSVISLDAGYVKAVCPGTGLLNERVTVVTYPCSRPQGLRRSSLQLVSG